jgi:Flp pilus assembly protein TadG
MQRSTTNGRATSRRSWTRFRDRLRISRDSKGQALVELALIVPVLLLLFLATIDLGRFYYSQITVTNSAREGALQAGVDPTSYTPGVCDAVTSKVVCAAVAEARNSFVTVAPADVNLTCSPACAKAYGNEATVTVTGHFTLLTPLISAFTGGQDITFQSTAKSDVLEVPVVVAATPLPTPAPTPTPDPGASPTPTPEPTPAPSPTPTPPPCPPPFASFTYTVNNKRVDFTSTSTPTSGDCAITSWRWDFGDTAVSEGNLPTVSHNYPDKNTDYNVKLTVAVPGSPTNITTEFFFTVTTGG